MHRNKLYITAQHTMIPLFVSFCIKQNYVNQNVTMEFIKHARDDLDDLLATKLNLNLRIFELVQRNDPYESFKPLNRCCCYSADCKYILYFINILYIYHHKKKYLNSSDSFQIHYHILINHKCINLSLHSMQH